MQTINLDNSIKTTVPTLYFKQKNVGSEFTARLFENSTALNVEGNSFSVWYSGTSGDGNYSTINGETAFFVDGNEVRVEMIAQMVNSPGNHEMCLIMQDADDNQIGFWNIPYFVEAIPGADSEEATQYFNELAGAADVAKEAAEDAEAAQVAAGLWAAKAERAADSVSNPVSYKPQELSAEEKAQARANIGAIGVDDVLVEASSDALSAQYDLKEGYGYTEGVYIAEDGATITPASYNLYRYMDFTQVKGVPANVTDDEKYKYAYNIFCAAYAFYDENKNPIGQMSDVKPQNEYMQILPKQDGYVLPVMKIDLKCVDYIPVEAGTSYTMYGCGYALYDAEKNWLTSVINTDWYNLNSENTIGPNEIMKFTPAVDGFVRLSIIGNDITYARFCKTSEEDKERREYEPDPNPFFDPCFPCDVYLYGDSNSSGEALVYDRDPNAKIADATDEDKANAWSNRLGALIKNMPKTTRHYRFSAFAERIAGQFGAILRKTGRVTLTAYTSEFEIHATSVGEGGLWVIIDGKVQSAAISDGDETVLNYPVDEGYHTLVLSGGISGTNQIDFIVTKKSRNFTNRAVYGNMSYNAFPATPEGSIALVMIGTNDRGFPNGITHNCIWDFYNKCKAAGVVPYIFTPVPTSVKGEDYAERILTIGDIIAQLPPDSINVYKDLQMIELLTGETIFCDALHLNGRGHKLLYAIAASKLGLAALNSELEGVSTLASDLDNIIDKQTALIGG